MQVKICGLSTPETIDAALAHGASHVGLNFFPPSPRAVSPAQAAGLAARAAGAAVRVGIYVDPDDALLEATSPFLDALQLHGASPARIAAVRARCGCETWGVVAVKTRADLAAARGFAAAADRLVYDARTPPGAALPGGMGVRFDWALLDGFDHPLPWLLSGGLDPGNVAEAIRRTGARAVDVSSGVERAPGVKDVDKIAAFLHAAGA